MNFEGLSSCNVCFCIHVDGVYNAHAIKLLQELFPEQTSENIILCRNCSSLLDMYKNINELLTENEKKFKEESKELNIANFIVWSNGESNDSNEEKCLICYTAVEYEKSKSVDDNIILQVFPNLDSTFCSNIKLCKSCKNIMYKLKCFRQNYLKIHSELPDVNAEDSEDFNHYYNSILNIDGSSITYDEDALADLNRNLWEETDKKTCLNYKVFLVRLVQYEIKPMRWNGVYLYKCPTCTQIVKDLEKHIETHDELYRNILYKCVKCDFENRSFDVIQTHTCKKSKYHDTSGKMFKCKLCPFRSNQKGNLKTHLLVHMSTEDIKMYKCDKCKFQSRQKGNLKTHELVHLPKDKIKMYNCNFCSFASRQKGNLQTHLLKKHQTK